MRLSIGSRLRIPHSERKSGKLTISTGLTILSAIKNEKLKFATKYMKMAISGELGRPLDKEIKRYNEICTDGTMRNQIAEQYKEYLRVYGNLMPGKPAPDFELIDDKGKVPLIGFKGHLRVCRCLGHLV